MRRCNPRSSFLSLISKSKSDLPLCAGPLLQQLFHSTSNQHPYLPNSPYDQTKGKRAYRLILGIAGPPPIPRGCYLERIPYSTCLPTLQPVRSCPSQPRWTYHGDAMKGSCERPVRMSRRPIVTAVLHQSANCRNAQKHAVHWNLMWLCPTGTKDVEVQPYRRRERTELVPLCPEKKRRRKKRTSKVLTS